MLVIVQSMAIKDLPRDIFGITMYSTQKAREKEFTGFVCVLSNLGLLKPQIFIGDLHLYVRCGVLSPQSASYFASGRASQFQVLKLETFLDVAKDLLPHPIKLYKLIQSWQKQSVFEVESTFLSPLVELDSSVDFSSERECLIGNNLADLQLI